MHQVRVRLPAVADMFYPGDPRELQAMVEHMLADASPADKRPKAIIAPHAGYIYSGEIAAKAYGALAPWRDTIERIVLLGPRHRIPFHGIAVSSADYYRTPLGDIPLDTESARELARRFDFVDYLDIAHKDEHSLEVHLPFLQSVLGDFELLPLVVGEADPAQVDAVLETVWGGPETLIVISSDLSHYHNDLTAKLLDQETAEAIESLNTRALDTQHACGAHPVRGLLEAAKKHEMRPVRVAMGNSARVSGDRSRVVGYGAWLFHELDRTLQ